MTHPLCTVALRTWTGSDGGKVQGVKLGQHLGRVAPGLYLDVAGDAVGVDDLAGLEKLFSHKKPPDLCGLAAKRKDLPKDRSGLTGGTDPAGRGPQSQMSTVTFLFSRLPAAFMSVRISLAMRP